MSLSNMNRYHKVSQTCSNEGICVAANYWYVRWVSKSPKWMLIFFLRHDMEYSGNFYPITNLTRDVALAHSDKTVRSVETVGLLTKKAMLEKD